MSSFEPVKKSALPQEIITKLLSLIRGRELQPGSKLPPERELAAMLQVSRPSLREALRALSIMHVIEMRQGDGTYISSLEPSLLADDLGFIFLMDDSTFIQLFEARRIVEAGIAALAAQRITEEQLADLEVCLTKAAATIGSHQAFLEADLDLHAQITEAAGNPFLTRFMASISQLGLASRGRTVEIPGVAEQALEDHRAIIAAIKKRDPEAARQAMLAHLDHVEDGLENLIHEQE